MPGEGLPDWVNERYEVEERIGAGVYTEVYRARDRVQRKPVAIKVLQPDYAEVPRVRDRFVTEAKAMARLVHANIVRVFDVGGALSNEPAIVMEYVGGGDLRAFVPKAGLDAAKAVRIALFALAGLVEAHKAGVTHRGLCPEAILLDEEGAPKLSDFGTARLERHNKMTTTMTVESLGSLFYMSPEQRAKARDVDVRTDVYAMGGLLYFLLLGRDPPDLSGAADAPAMVARLHPAVRPIVVKATAEQAGDRYQTAAEMGRAVRALFQG